MTTQTMPYGSWRSPISAAEVAKADIRLAFPVLVATGATEVDVWWSEGRPSEGGRQVVVSQLRGDLLPPPWNARTRVHEYGGACWLAVSNKDFPDLVFAEWSDQRLYRVGTEVAPRPLTPAPSVDAGWRYADPV